MLRPWVGGPQWLGAGRASLPHPCLARAHVPTSPQAACSCELVADIPLCAERVHTRGLFSPSELGVLWAAPPVVGLGRRARPSTAPSSLRDIRRVTKCGETSAGGAHKWGHSPGLQRPKAHR